MKLNLHFETGITLIITLILLTGISMLIAGLMQQTLLVNRLSFGFTKKLESQIEVENALSDKEKMIRLDPKAIKNIPSFFVPDHLEYGCNEGVLVFFIKERAIRNGAEEMIETTFVVRK